jgi:hypothetical protein
MPGPGRAAVGGGEPRQGPAATILRAVKLARALVVAAALAAGPAGAAESPLPLRYQRGGGSARAPPGQRATRA